MKSSNLKRMFLGGALACAIGSYSSLALSHQGMGAGAGSMMENADHMGMMGMIPGMGPGVMGMTPGMGPGMMGPGMMGMHAMHHGGAMGASGGMGMLELTDEQRAGMAGINDEFRSKNWGLMGKLMDAQAQLRDLVSVGDRDFAAIGEAYSNLLDRRHEMIDNAMAARKEKHALLTEDQRGQLGKGSCMKHGGMMSGSQE